MDQLSNPEKLDWVSLVKQYEKCTQSQSQFCRDNNLNLSQFVYYLNKYRKKPKHNHKTQTNDRGASFSAVSISGGYSGYQVILPNGIRLSLPQCFDIICVKQLIETLL